MKLHQTDAQKSLLRSYKVADSVEEVESEGERDGEFGREYRRAAVLHRLQRRQGVAKVPLGGERQDGGP